MSPQSQSRILLSQGRIADRTPRAIAGARAVADRLADIHALEVQVIGQPAPAKTDAWPEALAEAGPQLTALATAVATELGAGRRPLVIANTCAASLATLPVAARQLPALSLLWIDAHGDYNTPATSASAYLGGMALAAASGLWDSGHGQGIAPERSLLIGARDLDADEASLIRSSGAHILPPDPAKIAAQIGANPVWIHIDWDVMEPGLIPAAYAVPGGLWPDQVRAILAAIPPDQIAGIELAEFELPSHPTEADDALDRITEIVAPLFPAVR